MCPSKMCVCLQLWQSLGGSVSLVLDCSICKIQKAEIKPPYSCVYLLLDSELRAIIYGAL